MAANSAPTAARHEDTSVMPKARTETTGCPSRDEQIRRMRIRAKQPGDNMLQNQYRERLEYASYATKDYPLDNGKDIGQ